MTLDCRIEWGKSEAVIHLAGRLGEPDLAHLRQTITRVLSELTSPCVWLDLAELEHLDLASMHYLSGERQRLAGSGGWVRLRHPRPGVALIFRLNGLGGMLGAGEDEAGAADPAGDAADPAGDAPEPGEPPKLGPLVLAVDDESLVLNIINDFLVLAGYRVLRAHRASEALELFRRHGAQIDLVLIDLSLPDMTGMELLEALIALDPTVKAILASGHGSDELGRAAGHPSIRAILQKPFGGQQLVQTVQAVLGR